MSCPSRMSKTALAFFLILLGSGEERQSPTPDHAFAGSSRDIERKAVAKGEIGC